MKLRISAVSFLNAKPFVYGIEHSGHLKDFLLYKDDPATCAARLLRDEADIGLVPVAALPEMPECHLLSDCCIGCDGEVGSVCIFSETPLEEIESIWLDYQSRTSVLLARLLAAEHWRIAPRWLEGKEGYEKNIKGRTAGLVIGDRSFPLKGKFPYEYDLGSAWKQHTGLPFVFACWAANKQLPAEDVKAFSAAVAFGVQHRDKVITGESGQPSDASAYLHERISYAFDVEKRRAMDLFLSKAGQLLPV